MKTAYKNKRDQYKAEAERERRRAEEAERTVRELLKKQEKPAKEKRIEVKWFCRTCRVVATGTIPSGKFIEDFNCNNCGALTLLAVAKIPFDF